jgi:uncharacterized peroxidase-related enzyme
MARLAPLERSSLPSLEPTFALTEGFLGFLPNDVLTMAHMPQATRAFMEFCVTIYREATLPENLLHLVSLVASAAAGCRYCTSHTANKLSEVGERAEKIAAVWEFQTSPIFSAAEKAALQLAFGAGQSPSSVTDEDFKIAREHFSDREIVEILMIVCQFGFWNRWNDTVATKLEAIPATFSRDNLPATRWSIDKHE